MHEQSDDGSLLLRGQQVTLRPFTVADIGADYVGWLNDRDLMKFSNQRFRAHSTESCRAYVDSFAGSANLFMAIEHGAALVGTMSVYRSAAHGTADIGLMIGRGGGRGWGRDAWTTMLGHLLAQGTRKVTGGTLRCNVPMVKIMQACGMQPDGVRSAQELVDGQPQDVLYFAKFGSAC